MKASSQGRWLLAVAAMVTVIVVVAAAVVLWPGETEPQYQGKKLSEWLDAYKRSSAFEPVAWAKQIDGKTQQAVRNIGTNALPFLLRWIESDPWERHTERARLIARLPQRLQKIGFVERWAAAPVSYRGPLGFMILGPQGGGAIPRLDELVRDTSPSKESVAFCAAASLGYVGKQGLPVLIS